MANKVFNIEDRLVEYSCRMIDVVEALPKTRAGNYIAGQLIKSCISPAFNYGEVQGAESRSDFIHKLGIVLKELKECLTALKIIRKKELIKPSNRTDLLYKETEELIAIIAKSIGTAQKNRKTPQIEN
jgi:four helix bundle protein